jgi:cytochrome c5
MASQNSGKFLVGSIVTFLIIFGVVKIVLSTMLDIEKKVVAPQSMAADDIAERIKPIAQVHIGEPPAYVAPVVVEEVASGPGAKIVKQVCAMCHASGMMSSPKLGDAAAWAPRIEKGVDTLYNHAINGFNMMPARGGRADLTDDEVKLAVDHMLSLVK